MTADPLEAMGQALTPKTRYLALQSWVWVEASRPPAMRSIRSW